MLYNILWHSFTLAPQLASVLDNKTKCECSFSSSITSFGKQCMQEVREKIPYRSDYVVCAQDKNDKYEHAPWGGLVNSHRDKSGLNLLKVGRVFVQLSLEGGTCVLGLALCCGSIWGLPLQCLLLSLNLLIRLSLRASILLLHLCLLLQSWRCGLSALVWPSCQDLLKKPLFLVSSMVPHLWHVMFNGAQYMEM